MRNRFLVKNENILLVSVGGCTLLLAFLLQNTQYKTAAETSALASETEQRVSKYYENHIPKKNGHITTRNTALETRSIPPQAPGGETGALSVESTSWKGRQIDAVAGEILLSLHPGANEIEAWQVAQDMGSTPLSWVPALRALRLKVPVGQEIAQFANHSQSHPLVLEARPNHILRATACESVMETHQEPQWSLDRMGADDLCEDGDDTWIKEVRVAVMDSGVAYGSVEDALGTYEKAPGLASVTFDVFELSDVVNQDNVPADDHYHGTHITSIIANNAAFVGVSPNTTIIPIKILDRNGIGSESTLAEGMLLAASAGVDVVNLSVAFDPGYRPSWMVQEATRALSKSGAVIVASTGNAGADLVQFPGAFPDVIAVGASRIARTGSCNDATPTSYFDTFAGYSSSGAEVDILAPGGSVFHNRNCDGKADAIYAETIQISPRDPTQFETVGVTGTSQAAAHVTGAIAWLVANSSGLTPTEIRQRLLTVSKSIDGETEGFNTQQGSGLLQGNGLLDHNTLPALPEVYVNILPMFLDGDQGGIVAKARVEVLARNPGGQLHPIAGARVLGNLVGASQGAINGTTDHDGIVYLEGSELMPEESGSPISASVTFEIQAIIDPSAPNIPLRPMGFYQLGEGMGASLEQLLLEADKEEGSLPTSEALVLLEVNPNDDSLLSLTDGAVPLPAYIYKTLGAGNMTAPMASVMTLAFLSELDSESDIDPLTLEFDSPLSFGWGDADTLAGKFYQGSIQNLPSTHSTVILPMDALMASSTQNGAIIVNAHSDAWDAENEGFNSGEEAAAIATGYSATLFGTGYSATLFGTITQDTFYATSENVVLVGAGGDENMEGETSPELGSCTVDDCQAIDDD